MIDDKQEISNDLAEPIGEGEEQRRRSRRRGRRGKSRGPAAQSAETPPQPEPAVDPPIEAVPPLAPPIPEPPRPTAHLRPGKNTFRDGLDRQVCIARRMAYAEAWPVNYRTGLAVQPLIEVARTPDTLLLCDQSHSGPCIWPEYLGLVFHDADTEELSDTEDLHDKQPTFAELLANEDERNTSMDNDRLS